MANTLKTLNSRISKYDFVNPAIPLCDKMYLVIKSSDVVDGGLLQDNDDYAYAVCNLVCEIAGADKNDSSVGDWIMEGDYSDKTTIASVAAELKTLESN
jgi:hypothetical protein